MALPESPETVTNNILDVVTKGYIYLLTFIYDK